MHEFRKCIHVGKCYVSQMNVVEVTKVVLWCLEALDDTTRTPVLLSQRLGSSGWEVNYGHLAGAAYL